MDEFKAQELTENLIGRLDPVGDRYVLPGGVMSAREVSALRMLAGVAEPVPSSDLLTAKPAAPAIIAPPSKLDLDCLAQPRDESGILCVDFGTAFSKAAFWGRDEDAPVPLDLGALGGAQGLTLPSAAYIADDHVFFGQDAIRRHMEDGDSTRLLFDTPKEHLTHDHARFQSLKPSAAIDPTGRFRTRDLLALYLGYLTSLTCRRVSALGASRLVGRRFAAPGWGNAQISKGSAHFSAVAAQLAELLADAQILADTLSAQDWQNGLDVSKARSLLDGLAALTPTARSGAKFVERPVLEAVAAATGVQDRLVNRRPQVLVVDVGAGTTDIGAFKYRINDQGAVVSAYEGGMRAVRTAGNRMDDALIGLAWSKLGLASDSQMAPTHGLRMRPVVRDLKRDLFENGAVQVDLDGFDLVSIELPEFEATRPVAFFKATFEAEVKASLNGAGIGSRNFVQTNEPNIAVFTGGGGRLPFLRDALRRPIELDEGRAFFDVQDPIPEWLDDYGPDVAEVFPQLAVATGGCAPNLPDERNAIRDSSVAGTRSIRPNYK